MSNELSITAKLYFSKGGAKVRKVLSFTDDVTGDSFISAVQSIGTVEEELAQGADLGTPGWVWVKNLDSDNYVEFGATTGVYTIKIKAGKANLWYHDSATIYAKANTAAVLVDYCIVEV